MLIVMFHGFLGVLFSVDKIYILPNSLKCLKGTEVDEMFLNLLTRVRKIKQALACLQCVNYCFL